MSLGRPHATHDALGQWGPSRALCSLKPTVWVRCGVHLADATGLRTRPRHIVIPGTPAPCPLLRAARLYRRPVSLLFWHRLEASLRRQYKLEGDDMPLMPLKRDIFYGGLIHDGKWRDHVTSGKIQIVRGKARACTKRRARSHDCCQNLPVAMYALHLPVQLGAGVPVRILKLGPV